jgi:hypothetical protein
LKISHVIMSASLVVMAVAVSIHLRTGEVSTSVTGGDALRKQTLPDPVAGLTLPSNPEADAAAVYEELIRLVGEHPDALPGTREQDDLIAGVSALLVQAAGAGRVQQGFIDRHIPVEIGALPDFDDAVETAYELAIKESARRYTREDPQGARELAVAVWVLGERMFRHNDRLYGKVVGLDMMESAGAILYEISADDPTIDGEALASQSAAITGIRRAWQPKLEVMLGVTPPIGDLVNIAMNDEDRMFRVEATLRLGIFKHAAGSGGNRRMILRSIDQAIDSDDPMISEAGRAAAALTLEEKRRLY